MDAVLSKKQRREKIKENIAMHTYDEIAKLCGVSKRTVRRDIAQWRVEGGYDDFLVEEFFKLYGLVKVKDVMHAFDRICDLLRRRQDMLPVTSMGIEEIRLRWAPDELDTTDKLSPAQRAAKLSQEQR